MNPKEVKFKGRLSFMTTGGAYTVEKESICGGHNMFWVIDDNGNSTPVCKEFFEPINPVLANMAGELYIFGDKTIEYVGPEKSPLSPFERM